MYVCSVLHSVMYCVSKKQEPTPKGGKMCFRTFLSFNFQASCKFQSIASGCLFIFYSVLCIVAGFPTGPDGGDIRPNDLSPPQNGEQGSISVCVSDVS